MTTLSNGDIFRVNGPLCGEFTGHWWIPLTKASDAELWRFLLIYAWADGWVNNREAGDLRRHHVHYDVTVMYKMCCLHFECRWNDWLVSLKPNPHLYRIRCRSISFQLQWVVARYVTAAIVPAVFAFGIGLHILPYNADRRSSSHVSAILVSFSTIRYVKQLRASPHLGWFIWLE